MTHKILIIDDEEDFLRSASLTLRMSGYREIVTCTGVRDARRLYESDRYSLVLLDIMMPDGSGKELLPELVQLRPDTPVIMSTAVNEVDVAVECMRAGAYDYLVKPIEKERLLTSIQNAFNFFELKQENSRLSEMFTGNQVKNENTFKQIITRNENVLSQFRYVEAIAPGSMPVLILGETGSGKELFARAVHDASGRTGNFVAVNVAGLDDTLFSDTLFGHERGAFTGADKKREGLIAKTGDGTLFLDEIGDLRQESQVKLLRLLEERTFYPVGSDTIYRAQCRFVVATGVDLYKAVNEGKFRKDLFYRLKSHTVRIPPLRERTDDIGLLLNHFIADAAEELGKQIPTYPSQLPQLLKNHTFPGNIRELRGIIYDAVSRHTGGILSMDVFKEHISPDCQTDYHMEQSRETQSALTLGDRLPTLKEAEDILVTEAMKRCDNNQSQAARLLGITPSALNKRLNKC